jgi:hypothetical protein
MPRTRLLQLLFVGALATAAPAAAQMGSVLDRAAEALRANPVYVDPAAASELSAADAEKLRERIDAADAGAFYIAVLPAEARNEAGGDASGVLSALHDSVHRPGTYAVYVGDEFRAGSDYFTVREIATDAARENDGTAATLLAFVDGVADRQGGGSDGSGGGRGALVVPLLAVGAVGFFLLRRQKRRRRADADFAEVKAASQDDLLALADDIRALDLDVEMPGANERAKEDYGNAVNLYEKADRLLDQARRPEDLEEVSAAVEEGRWAMVSAKARLEGRKPPERRPPCFFDPRHGPSERDVEWTPPWGSPRPVPACEADAQIVERGLEPAAREVTAQGRRVPYWNAGPAYGPWAGGFFSPFGGLFPGILIGSMLGGAFSPPIAYGAGSEGGDSGNGDFGGGDFGGGDFGGGDFGGGDFGGGDF